MGEVEEQAIRAAIRGYNRDVMLRAWIALGMGLGTIVLVFGFLALLAWLVSLFALGFFSDHRGLFVWGITGVFFAASVVGAWRRDDPLQHLGPLTDAQMFAIAASWGVSGVMVTSPRHAVAGFAMLFLHGPATVLESIGLFRSRLPSDGALVGAAARVLRDSERGVRVEDIAPARAGVLLHRVLFIKPDRSRADGKWFVMTEKAREAVGASQARTR